MEPKFRAATSGVSTPCGRPRTLATACCSSVCLAPMSVPNSYSTVMMLMPSFEKELYAFTSLVILTACSSGDVTPRSTSPAARPGATVKTVTYGKVRSGIGSSFSDVIAKAPKRIAATTARPTMERLRRASLVSRLMSGPAVVRSCGGQFREAVGDRDDTFAHAERRQPARRDARLAVHGAGQGAGDCAHRVGVVAQIHGEDEGLLEGVGA